MLSAADYDIRGSILSVEPSAVIYDARQIDNYALPFDVAALRLEDLATPPRPPPFTFAGLSPNTTMAPPSDPLSLTFTGFHLPDTIAPPPPQPNQLPFDFAALHISDTSVPPSSPLPFNFAALHINDTIAPAPSPLPFDFTKLQLDEPCIDESVLATFPMDGYYGGEAYQRLLDWLENNPTIGWRPRDNIMWMEVFCFRAYSLSFALSGYDYAALEQYARNRFDFNMSRKIYSKYTPNGYDMVPALHSVVKWNPAYPKFKPADTVRLIQWLIANGADPACVDRATGKNMMQTLETCIDWPFDPVSFNNHTQLKLALQAVGIN